MATKQDQRYNEIAKACLQALNQAASNPTDKEKSIKKVYEAIDKAFNKQTAVMQRELQSTSQALEKIRDTAVDLDEAQGIAKDILDNLSGSASGKGLH